jgi:hypothetical protein
VHATATTGPRAWILAVGLAAVAIAVAVMLVVTLAWWGWRWFGPAPADFTSAAPSEPALALTASGLFAAPAGSAPAAAADSPARPASGEMRLQGVMAEEGGKGFALFRLPGGPKLVAAGQVIADDATLVSVQRDGVTVRDGGGERRLVLRAPVAAPGPKPSARSGPGNAACAVPAGFKGDTLKLNAELAGGIVAQPDAWTALATADRGALTVRDDSGFSAMLAMKKGDRIEQANGIALKAPEDIVNAVLRPLTAGQPVRLAGTRGGAPREWLLLNAGNCP